MKPKLLLTLTVPLLLLSIPPVSLSIHPSVGDPSMDGRVDAGEGLGAGLSGFQGGVSGPPPPQAGKLRLRKERTRPLQTTTYSTTSSPLQSKPMSRLENLNHQRTYSVSLHLKYVFQVER